MKDSVHTNSARELLPYLILDETADVGAFKARMEKEGIEIALKWRYYYGYNDAIRIIDFVETKGIYDAWAVLLPRDCQAKADALVQEQAFILSHFEPAEEAFFRGLETVHLEKALASQQMKGRSLALALKILQEQNIRYNKDEIKDLKETLVLENAKKSAKTGRTKILIWCILMVIIIAYLYLIGLFS